MPDKYRQIDVTLGRTGRTARFKKDQVSLYLNIYDENREDNAVDSYNHIIEEIGLMLRQELGITKADLKKKETKNGKSKGNTKDKPVLNKDKELPGSGDKVPSSGDSVPDKGGD